MRYLVWLAAASACASGTIPPVHPGGDPVAHEVHLIAFADEQYLVIERVVGAQPRLELVAVRPGSRERTRFGNIDADLDPWPGPAGAIAALRATDTGAAIEKLGFAWAERAAESTTLDTEHGSLQLQGHEVHLTDGEYHTVVAELADIEASDHTWYKSGNGHWAALALAYDGAPSTRDLRVVALEPAAAKLFALRAFDHHQRREFATALGFWKTAVRLDPGSARSHYNLACAHARLGNATDALPHLGAAVRIGGDRFRKLAARDPDLDSLRGSDGLEQILRRERPKPKKCPWKIPVLTCD